MSKRLATIGLLLAAVLLLASNNASACAACAGGKVSSELAEGMNWGIFSLLGVVVFVLGSIATFFIYIIRRSASMPVLTEPETISQATQKI